MRECCCAVELDPVVVGDFVPEVRCDGLHQLDAPDNMLCTLCFPNGREALHEAQDDDFWGDDSSGDDPGGEA